MENNDLQEEFYQLLGEVKRSLHNIEDTKDAVLCILWLARLATATAQEGTARNKLLSKLQSNIEHRELQFPFCDNPTDENLETYLNDEVIKTARDLNSEENNMTTNRCENSIFEYKMQANKYRKAIDEYQRVIKALLEYPPAINRAEQNERNGSSVDHRTEKENQNGICACDEGHKSCISQINAIRSRVDLLEKEKRSLKKMCNEMRRASIDLTKPKVENAKGENGQLSLFKEEMAKALEKKDKEIARLERQVQEKTLNDTVQAGFDFEEQLKTKLSECETKYTKILDDMVEKHKAERIRDVEAIANLQELLFSSQTAQKE